MRNPLVAAVFATALGLAAGPALADDIEGNIESVDAGNQAFVVQGITFYTTNSTDYDDGLTGFNDLREGQRVEVDFNYRDGKHWVTEVELDN